MIQLKGASEFIKGIDSWLEETETQLNWVFRGFCVVLFHNLALNTPQWSGNAASNWRLSVDTLDTSVDTNLLQANVGSSNRVAQGRQGGYFGRGWGPPLFSKGDPYAVQMAVARNKGNDTPIKLESTVFISNSSESLSGKAYIQMLEDNPGNFLRAVNEPGHMVRDTAIKADQLNFSTPGEFKVLAAITLGDLNNGGLSI